MGENEKMAKGAKEGHGRKRRNWKTRGMRKKNEGEGEEKGDAKERQKKNEEKGKT